MYSHNANEALAQLVAEQKADDTFEQRPEFRGTASLDKVQYVDDGGHPVTLGDGVGIDPTNAWIEATDREAPDVEPDPTWEPTWVWPRRRDRYPKYPGKPTSWWHRLPARDRAAVADALYESLVYFRCITLMQFPAGRGRRPAGEADVLAMWLWVADSRGAPRELLSIVTGRSLQSISDLIARHQSKRVNENGRRALNCKWIPSTMLEDGRWRYTLTPTRLRDTRMDSEAATPVPASDDDATMAPRIASAPASPNHLLDHSTRSAPEYSRTPA